VKDDFAVETSDSFLSLWKDISSGFFVVMVGIASISARCRRHRHHEYHCSSV